MTVFEQTHGLQAPERHRDDETPAAVTPGHRRLIPAQRAGTRPARRFAPPPPSPHDIARPRLLDCLDRERGARVITVVAPAGFGKSTLLAAWAADDERSFAWIDLGAPPFDPAGLLAAIEDALRTLAGTPAGELDAQTDATGSSQQGLLAAIAAACDGAIEAVIVLDGAERLRGEPALDDLAGLIRELPSGLTLAIASRAPLRLGLGRLRARQLVLDIDAVDLTMTSYEAYTVLQRSGVEVSEEALQEIVERTEGWPAAIGLSARARRAAAANADPAAASIAESAQIAEYVHEEVLAGLPPEVLGDLRRLSVLERICGELADALLEREGSGRMLMELAEHGAMLVPQDVPGHWYRCHRLLRSALASELELLDPELERRMHARASDWFAQHGESVSALDHAVAAGDPERAGKLLWDELGRLLRGREPHAEQWLGAFSPAARAADPRLRLAGALRDLMGGSVSSALEAARSSGDARREGAQETPAQQACVHAIEAAACRQGVDQMAASARRASKLAPAGPLRSLALLLEGVAEHLRDERAKARADLSEAARLTGETVPLVQAMALSQQALMDVEDGEWETAAERSRAAVEVLAHGSLELDPAAALTPAVSALVTIHFGVADEAKQSVNLVSRLLEAFTDQMPWYEVEVLILTARASTRLGDITGARALLAQASRRARRAGPSPRLVEWLDEAWGEVDEASARSLSGQGALTIAELRVLRFLPSHLSFREIGERLNVSGNTVKTQTHAIYAKLGVTSRTDAVTRAAGLGLIDPAIL